MKAFITLILLFICVTGIAQIPAEDINPIKKEEQKAEIKKLKDLAEQRTIVLQKELNFNNHTFCHIKNSIIKYSIKANKVIQSNVSTNEKSKSLSNLVYFQNKELKEVLTVSQFYKYINLRNVF